MDNDDDHSTIDDTELYSINGTIGEYCVYSSPVTVGDYCVYIGSSRVEAVEVP